MNFSKPCPICETWANAPDVATLEALIRAHLENEHPNDGPINMKFNLRRAE